MKGLLDNMFDFDHDGKLGFFERAAKRQFINNVTDSAEILETLSMHVLTG